MKTVNNLKYKINHYVGQLPRQVTIGDLIAKLEKADISRDNFYRDRKIEKDSATSIPSDRLIKYAKIFGVSQEDLLNYDVKIKSIHEDLLAREPKKRVKTKLS